MFIVAFLVTLLAAGGILRRAAFDPMTRGLAVVVAVVLMVGTIFYMAVEEWSFLDSLYFTVVTLTTVGFGDLTPETNLGKVFTIVYIFTGVGLLMGFATTIVQSSQLWVRLEDRAANAEGRPDDDERSVPSPDKTRTSGNENGER